MDKNKKKTISISSIIKSSEKIKRIFKYKTNYILITENSINFLTKNFELDFKYNLKIKNFSEIKIIKEKKLLIFIEKKHENDSLLIFFCFSKFKIISQKMIFLLEDLKIFKNLIYILHKNRLEINYIQKKKNKINFLQIGKINFDYNPMLEKRKNIPIKSSLIFLSKKLSLLGILMLNSKNSDFFVYTLQIYNLFSFSFGYYRKIYFKTKFIIKKFEINSEVNFGVFLDEKNKLFFFDLFEGNFVEFFQDFFADFEILDFSLFLRFFYVKDKEGGFKVFFLGDFIEEVFFKKIELAEEDFENIGFNCFEHFSNKCFYVTSKEIFNVVYN